MYIDNNSENKKDKFAQVCLIFLFCFCSAILKSMHSSLHWLIFQSLILEENTYIENSSLALVMEMGRGMSQFRVKFPKEI